jgi:hypothetical protein
MKNPPGSVRALDLAAMAPADVRRWVFDTVRFYTGLRGREKLAKWFEKQYDESQTLADLLDSTDHGPFVRALVIGGLIDVLINPSRLWLEWRGLLVESKSPEGRDLLEKVKHLEKAAEILGAFEKGDLAAEVSREAAARRSRLTYDAPGKKQSPQGALACELELLLSKEKKLSAARRLEIIAGLVADFVCPTSPEKIRQLLKETRRRDRLNRKRNVVVVASGITRTNPDAPWAEFLETPKPDSHFSGAAVKVVKLEGDTNRGHSE